MRALLTSPPACPTRDAGPGLPARRARTHSYVMTLDAESHIRQLCAEALAAEGEAEQEWIIRKLRIVLADYIRLKEETGTRARGVLGF